MEVVDGGSAMFSRSIIQTLCLHRPGPSLGLERRRRMAVLKPRGVDR
jgi:hypothetical protein